MGILLEQSCIASCQHVQSIGKLLCETLEDYRHLGFGKRTEFCPLKVKDASKAGSLPSVFPFILLPLPRISKCEKLERLVFSDLNEIARPRDLLRV